MHDVCRLKEGPAARSLRPVERRVLRKKDRESEGGASGEMQAPSRQKGVMRKPLKELYVNGGFAEKKSKNGRSWRIAVQKSLWTRRRRSRSRSRGLSGKKRDEHFSEEGSVAQISVDLVLQARAKMTDNEVNGPEDSVASEMIQQFPPEKH